MVPDIFMVNSTLDFDNAIKSDHFDTLVFSKYKKTTKQQSPIKTFLGENDYKAEQFRQTFYSWNWDKLYQTSDFDERFDRFTNAIVQAQDKHAPIKNCFIKNEKNIFFLSE